MRKVEEAATRPSTKDTHPNPNNDSTASRVRDYYKKSSGYLTSPLGGTCHFGYTPEGQPFELNSALHSMEIMLGEKLALPPGSLVLDAGCGYGRVATTMANEHGLNVVGIDLTPVRLEEALRYTRAQGVSEKVHLLEGNYCALPIQDSTFAGVFTMETLCHADPLEAALGEFRRVLKPGGRLILFEYSIPDPTYMGLLHKKITNNMVRRTGMASIKRFTHGIFPSLLESAGFENITVDEISHNVYPTWRWLFFRAIREDWPRILRGKFKDNTNLAGSLLIWPYRHHLGYSVVTGTKRS